MAVIRAILRAQWRSMPGGRARGPALIGGIVWYGLWTFIAIASGVSLAGADATTLTVWLPLGLLGVCAYWQLVPALSGNMGASLDLRKLLIYPIPRRSLFTVEVLLRFVTALEMLLVVAGGVAGLLANGSASGWRVAPAAALFVLFNVLLASGTRSLLERLFARRRVREIVVLLFALVWVAPRLLIHFGPGRQALGNYGAALDTVALPWSAAARVALGEAFPWALPSLCLWTLAAGWFGRWQFDRSLRFDAAAAQASRAGARGPGPAESFYRFPGMVWRDPLAAMIEKELRTLARTPRFRTVFIMGFTFGLAVWFPAVAGDGARGGPDTSWFLTAVSVYALTLLGQVSYWNCFGFDRGAAAFYFAAPVSFGRVLAAKNVAALIFIYCEVFVVIVVTSAFRLAGGWTSTLETLAVMGICAVYLLAVGNWASIRYPRGLSGDRVAQGGGRGAQAFLFLIYPVALLPVGLAYLARYALESELAFGLVLALAAVIGGVFFHIAMESAVGLAGRRREQMLQELSAADGPVAE